MPLKLEWLYYYVVLAESESFNVAANRLCISQQALSKHLAQIEDRLGTQLIQRAQRFEKLTPSGELLLQKARRILSRAEALETLFLPPEDKGKASSLRLGTAPLLETRLLPFLRQLLSERTAQPIQLQSLPETEIESRLQRGELDFGFINAIPKTRGLQHQLFSQSPYVIVTASGRKSRDWQELSFIRLLHGESASDPWPERQWPRQVIAEADLKMALALCSHGQGALLLPQVLAEPWLRPGRLQLGPPPPFELHFRSYLAWSEHTRQAPERLEWLQRLRQIGE